MNRTTVVIPTYNEKENISLLVPQLFKIIPDISILVVDDNSPDGTGGVVTELQRQYPRLTLISRPNKDGLGGAYIKAFKKLIDDSEIKKIVMMDADLSHDPKYLSDMIKKSEIFDVVVGSRYVLSGGTVGWEAWRRLLSLIGNFYCRVITGMPIHDCTGGFNVISAALLRKIDLSNLDMSGYAFIMQLKYTLFRAGGKFIEVPIIFTNRSKGESKISQSIISEGIIAPWKMIMRKYKQII